MGKGNTTMKTISDYIDYQKDFDEKHFSNFDWAQKISDDNLDVLSFLLISLLGEIGETSNILKKILRGDATLKELRSSLNEEVVDIFIYVLKLIYQLDIDIEYEYFKKMRVNKERFSKYEGGDVNT